VLVSQMPDAVAHYKILDHIGTGVLGDVFRTRDTNLGRTVALTVLPASLVDDAERLDELLQTARAAAVLSHPNIAALFEIGQDGPHRYLAFEFVPGELLSAKIGGHRLDVRRALDFAVQLADAVAEAERHGIGHGDIRTDTIVITPTDRPKLLQFGLSGFAGGASRSPTAPPESAPDESPNGRQDVSNDIRALGLVMYEMLTGRQLPAATGESRTASPAAMNTAVPLELDDVVCRALSVDPEKRYQTATTLAAELRAVAAILDARAAAAGDALDVPRTSPRRSRPLTAVVVLAALVGLVFWIWRGGVWRLWG
jgi:eukaryotic-like serine/threonine-protein kinase